MEAAQPAEQSGGEHVRAAQTAPHGGKLVDVGPGAPPGDPRPVERADRRADDDVRVDAGCEQGVQHSDLHGAERGATTSSPFVQITAGTLVRPGGDRALVRAALLADCDRSWPHCSPRCGVCSNVGLRRDELAVLRGA